MKNNSKLSSHLQYLTDNRLSPVTLKICSKICFSSIYKPLEIILRLCVETGAFPSEWKKDIVPIRKNAGKY